MEANPTLDQLSIFAAVADCGGFSAAARRLKRSQSVVSYAIANLEDQLQVKLLSHASIRRLSSPTSPTRRAVVTLGSSRIAHGA